MKKIVKNILRNPLFTGSAIMVIGTNVFNVGQFAYHFLTIRLLTTTDYGDLAAIISILGIIGVIQTAFGMTIIKFVASQKNKSNLSNLIKWFNYWGFLMAMAVSMFVLITSPFLGKFLNMTQPNVIYLLAPILFLSLIVYIQRSVLQGLLLFRTYVTSITIEVVMKILATVLLTLLGMQLLGVIIGMLVGTILGFAVTRLSLVPYFLGSKGNRPELKSFFIYSVPVLLQGISFTSMSSIDILLVKHFFQPHDAGVYAYISILGRIAIYAAAPITQTMFPLVSKRFTNKQSYLGIFYLSLFFVTSISLLVVLLFKFFPNFLISLFGKADGGELLWWFGLSMTLLGTALIFVQFFLSINKTKMVSFFVIAAILQPLLIWFIHPNLLTVIQISILCSALLNIVYLVYFLYYRHGQK